MAGTPRVAGFIFRAPLGTPIPVDAKTPLSSAFVELGYASADGWARQINKSYNAVTAYGGDEVLKSRSEHSVGFTLTLIESLNAETNKAKWGEAAVTVTPATSTSGQTVTISYKGADTEAAVYVCDMEDHGRLRRTVFPNAIDTTDSFEQTFNDSDPIGLPFTFSAYKDEVTGLYFTDYMDDGKVLKA